jgi:hypothetical protein
MPHSDSIDALFFRKKIEIFPPDHTRVSVKDTNLVARIEEAEDGGVKICVSF